MSTMLIDNGENCYIKGTRILEELEGTELFLSFLTPVSEWALSNGAHKYVGTNTNQVRFAAKGIMDMVIYII